MTKKIDYATLKTPADWTTAGRGLVADCRDAARSGDRGQMESAAGACGDFIDNRALECPKDVTHIVADVQVELSQLIVADDIGSIKARTAQFEAYLQDIDHLVAANETAADLISFQSAGAVVAEVTGVVKDLKALGKQFDGNDAATAQTIQALADRLQKVQDAFQKLSNA